MSSKLLNTFFAINLALIGCSSGTSKDTEPNTEPEPSTVCNACAPNRLVGVAAGGAPIASGALGLVDSVGARLSATVAANGSYSLDVASLTGPFLIEVAGMVGGRPTVLHTLALASDIGANAVNITPFTELLTSFVLGADPRVVFNSASPDLSKVTKEALESAEKIVADKLGPILESYGVSDANIRTTEFTTDGSGIDGALDAVNVTQVQDASSGGLRYQLKIATDLDTILLDPAALGSLSLTVNPTLLTQIATILPQINARLQAIESLFATAVPEVAALTPFFNASVFRQNGLDLDGYLSKVLRKDTVFVGSKLSRAAVEQLDTAEHILISFTVKFAPPSTDTKRISWWMRKINNVWLIEGNDKPADVGVFYLARLTAIPLSWEEILSRTDEYLTSIYQDGTLKCYAIKKGIPIDETNVRLFYQCSDDGNNFGTIARGGYWPYYDLPETSYNERELMRQYSRYIGQASARMRPYIIPSVSTTEVDPRVHHVKVHGPGLPGDGLTLTWPRINIPRSHFILEGDWYDWNAFDTLRCGQLHPQPTGCSLDWSQVKAGSEYMFSFYDSAEAVNPFETMVAQLLGRPRSPEDWMADKDRLFPHFNLSPAQHFSVANILDLSGGFKAGGTVTMNWSVPQDPTVSMRGLAVSREYYIEKIIDDDHQIKETHFFSLVGSTATEQECIFDSHAEAQVPTAWAWSTLTAQDIYGNLLEHEVAPENPY